MVRVLPRNSTCGSVRRDTGRMRLTGRRRDERDAERLAMLDLIAEFVAIDGQDCDLDPTGECRPHGYPTVEAERPCPYQEARDLLASAAPELKRRRQAHAAQARKQIEHMLDALAPRARR